MSDECDEESRAKINLLLIVFLDTHIVGCGLVKFTKRISNYDYKVHVFACNYSWTNVYTLPVYKKGATASECKTGRHYYYPGLCSDDEKIKASFW